MNCPQCGNIVKEGAKFCPVCGSQMNEQLFGVNQEQPETNQNLNQETVNQDAQQTESQQNTYQQTYQSPPVVQPVISSGPNDVKVNKGYAVLSYLGILFLIPYLVRKDSEYARYHAKQGMNLFIFSALSSVFFSVLDYAFGMISGALGVLLVGIIGLLQTCISVGVVVLMVIGIINAVQGKMQPLPFIGKLGKSKE